MAASSRATLRRHERLSESEDFQRAFGRKRSVSDHLLIVYAAENGLDYTRLGISISKKKIRRATARNRTKRLLREAFRLNKSRIPRGLDLVVVPRGQPISFNDAASSLPELANSAARRLGASGRSRPGRINDS